MHGNYYGTHKGQVEEIRRRGKICLIEIDVYGAEKINRSMPNLVNYILIKPPSIDELRNRMNKRYGHLPYILKLGELSRATSSSAEWEGLLPKYRRDRTSGSTQRW